MSRNATYTHHRFAGQLEALEKAMKQKVKEIKRTCIYTQLNKELNSTRQQVPGT